VISIVPVAPTPLADLSIGISGNTPGARTVTVAVTNLGPYAAAAPRVDLVLKRPARSMPSGCSTGTNRLTISCTLGTLALNQRGRVNVPVVDGPDVVGLRVLSSTADPVTANNVWSVVPGTISLDRPLSGILPAVPARVI
jgi:hypothetical protein